MNHRNLGKTGITVSEVSFGTVSLGLPYGIGVQGQEDMPSETEALSLLQTALDAGINFFDTAREYGCSEERLGRAFRHRRHDVVICTKCRHLYDENHQLLPDDRFAPHIETSLQESLAALQTDYLDIYMLHTPEERLYTHPVITELFTGYKRRGLVRALGVSTYTPAQTRRALESGIWDVIQLPYNLMDQRQAELFPLAADKGVGIVVRSVLFKGILTDRGRNLHPALQAVERHRETYLDLLDETTPSLAALAVRFVLSHRDVSSVLIGIDKPAYLQTALELADGRYLDDDTLQRARRLAYPDPDFLDLHQWQVNGWLT